MSWWTGFFLFCWGLFPYKLHNYQPHRHFHCSSHLEPEYNFTSSNYLFSNCKPHKVSHHFFIFQSHCKHRSISYAFYSHFNPEWISYRKTNSSSNRQLLLPGSRSGGRGCKTEGAVVEVLSKLSRLRACRLPSVGFVCLTCCTINKS